MEKMFSFMTSLHNISQDRASFSLEFSHFERKLNGEKPATGIIYSSYFEPMSPILGYLFTLAYSE